MQTILEIKNVKKSFDQKLILKGINLTVEEGEIISVLGPSGCGKSTLLNIIAGILPLDEGVVVISGKEVSGSNKYLPIEKRNINMVFQDFALWPHMTARDNILYGLRIKKINQVDMEKQLEEVVALLHLEGLLDHFPSELSGGQQQRVAIARALITKPALILLDEPLCNLDVQLRVEMRTEMARLFHQLKTTVFHVTHDPSEAFAMADRIIVMNGGVIDQVDTPAVCYTSPKTAMVAGLLGAGNSIKKAVLEKQQDDRATVFVGTRSIAGLTPGFTSAMAEAHVVDAAKEMIEQNSPNNRRNLSSRGVELRFRPEDCHWTEEQRGTIAVKVIMSTFEGALYRVKVITTDGEEFCLLCPQKLIPGVTGNVRVDEDKLFVYPA